MIVEGYLATVKLIQLKNMLLPKLINVIFKHARTTRERKPVETHRVSLLEVNTNKFEKRLPEKEEKLNE